MPAPSPAEADKANLLGLATASVQKSNLGPALGHLKSLLDIDPNHELALGMLAAVYAELKMTQQLRIYSTRKGRSAKPAKPRKS